MKHGNNNPHLIFLIILSGRVRSRTAYFIDDDLILTHEIGHALGYNHVDRLGHIMNPMRPDADYYFY